MYDKFGGYRFDVWHDDEDNDEFVGTFDIDDIKIEEPVNDYTDDELEDMERYYGLLDDEHDEMWEHGVSWSDFI